jgi:imidazolonepropionase-like amidohydrolase
VQRIESAADTGLASAIVDNLKATVAKGREVYRWARRYQVPIAFGTDLWGPEAQKSQVREFAIRADLDVPPNIIRSATRTNADLLMQGGNLGSLLRAPMPTCWSSQAIRCGRSAL